MTLRNVLIALAFGLILLSGAMLWATPILYDNAHFSDTIFILGEGWRTAAQPRRPWRSQ